MIIDDIKIGQQVDWKFGLITRTVYRKTPNLFEIDETSGNWYKAIVTKNRLQKVIDGKESILNLNWK